MRTKYITYIHYITLHTLIPQNRRHRFSDSVFDSNNIPPLPSSLLGFNPISTFLRITFSCEYLFPLTLLPIFHVWNLWHACFCTCFVHLLKALFFVCSELFYAGKYLFFGEAMDAKVAHRLQFSSLIQNEKIIIGRSFCGSVKFSRVFKEPKNFQVCVLQHESVRVCSNRPRGVPLEVSCSYNNFPGCCLFINRILFFDQLFGFFLFFECSNCTCCSIIGSLSYYYALMVSLIWGITFC